MSSGAKSEKPAASPHLTCRLCETSWPPHLTVQHQGHTLCCPCHAKLKEEAFAKEAERKLSQHRTTTSRAQGAMLVMTSVIVIVGAAVLAMSVYLLVDWAKKRKKTETPAAEAVALPPAIEVDSTLLASQLTLKSKAVINDVAFLVRGPAGIRAVVAAAKFNQALASNPKAAVPAGTPAVTLIEKWTLNAVLPELKVINLGATAPTVAVSELSDNPTVGGDRKIWQLKLKEADESALPVIVLNPQPNVAEVTQPVHLIHLKAAGDKQVQATLPGYVDSTYLMGTRLVIKLAEKRPAEGMIGCPVVNSQGQFVGVVSEVGEQPDAQGKVEFAVVMSSFDLFGIAPPPKAKDPKAPASPTAPARK